MMFELSKNFCERLSSFLGVSRGKRKENKKLFNRLKVVTKNFARIIVMVGICFYSQIIFANLCLEAVEGWESLDIGHFGRVIYKENEVEVKLSGIQGKQYSGRITLDSKVDEVFTISTSGGKWESYFSVENLIIRTGEEIRIYTIRAGGDWTVSNPVNKPTLVAQYRIKSLVGISSFSAHVGNNIKSLLVVTKSQIHLIDPFMGDYRAKTVEQQAKITDSLEVQPNVNEVVISWLTSLSRGKLFQVLLFKNEAGETVKALSTAYSGQPGNKFGEFSKDEVRGGLEQVETVQTIELD